MAFTVSPRDAGIRFAVHVQPRAKRPGIDGTHGDALRVRVQAPPVEGAANDAVIAVIAGALGVPLRAVRIAAGHGSRQKLVDVDGIDPSAATARLLAPES
ncbi:MAG TPA: DUF167 domain-containing protein [Gemmatimonadaceae bacterium]|jgi:hypothetical protein